MRWRLRLGPVKPDGNVLTNLNALLLFAS